MRPSKERLIKKEADFNTPSFSQITVERENKIISFNSFNNLAPSKTISKGSDKKIRKPNFSFGNLKGIDRGTYDSLDALIEEYKFEESYCPKCNKVQSLDVDVIKIRTDIAKFWLIFGILFLPFLPISLIIFCCLKKKNVNEYRCIECRTKIEV